jgi:agmatinase
MKGTAQAPEAIAAASSQLEFYEEELGWEPTQALNIHSLAPLVPGEGESPESYLRREAELLKKIPAGAFVIGLGGEHTVTPPLVRHAIPEGGTVIAIDAHPDLRDSYEGERFSHACAMRRVAEEGRRLVQIGLGCITPEEEAYVREHGRITHFPSYSISDPAGFARLLDCLSRLEGDAYLSVDVDGLCTSIMPGTGTPVPGGLLWREMMAVVRTLLKNPALHLRGMDVVEVRPLPGNPLSEFTAAKLIQKCLSFHFHRGNR